MLIRSVCSRRSYKKKPLMIHHCSRHGTVYPPKKAVEQPSPFPLPFHALDIEWLGTRLVTASCHRAFSRASSHCTKHRDDSFFLISSQSQCVAFTWLRFGFLVAKTFPECTESGRAFKVADIVYYTCSGWQMGSVDPKRLGSGPGCVGAGGPQPPDVI